MDRVAAAPISWGVSEVPGWGFQLAPSTVLLQMHELGLAATELGPEGFLPHDAADQAAVLSEHGLYAVGQFVPVVLHRDGSDPRAAVDTSLEVLRAVGGRTMVLAAATGMTGYDERPALGADDWRRLLTGLNEIAAYTDRFGVRAVLHPHVGTMIESADELERVLRGCGIGLCLDTGHLLVGGADPVRLAQEHPDRIAHVHLKDVRADLAERVRRGELPYTDAVRDGLYVPLGAGDVDTEAIVSALEQAGYAGWYVLEQDTILVSDPTGTPQDPRAAVQTSLDYLRTLCEVRR